MIWMIQSQILAGARYFSVVHVLQTGCGAHAAFFSVVARGSFIRCKAARTWSWHLPPPQSEVKNEWICTCRPHICLSVWMGTKLPLFLFLFDFIILCILVLPLSTVLEIRDISWKYVVKNLFNIIFCEPYSVWLNRKQLFKVNNIVVVIIVIVIIIVISSTAMGGL